MTDRMRQIPNEHYLGIYNKSLAMETIMQILGVSTVREAVAAVRKLANTEAGAFTHK